jgi:mRNA m6A methyltransferase catalytic subunit
MKDEKQPRGREEVAPAMTQKTRSPEKEQDKVDDEWHRHSSRSRLLLCLLNAVIVMSDDALKVVAAAGIRSLFSSGNVSTPVSAFKLLTRLVAFKAPEGLLSPEINPARFRLTDLHRLEGILESLSKSWDDGIICLKRENGELFVVDLILSKSGERPVNPRKRKRVVDEEADSAAGSDEEDNSREGSNGNHGPLTALDKLTAEQREIYALLQKPTAKQKLLAERVSSSRSERRP